MSPLLSIKIRADLIIRENLDSLYTPQNYIYNTKKRKLTPLKILYTQACEGFVQ